MSSNHDDDIDMSDVKIEIEDNEVEVQKSNEAKQKLVTDNETATPLEDRFGRSLWIPTRMCYCPNNALTDCRFHSPEEKGWEKCPNTDLSEKNKMVTGRQLWARNPMYGKPLTEEEAGIKN